ncbi:TRAP transporter large permease [Draconibacterium halophilum]|uniref:TRAP transporter large permease n=1 Tax=Draconibacterium halophilum TaxID=2706887 RepID=A0A6C0RE69_9BACT|nr:TRAP transporter large permease [Draconibacterium halophilum]QIA08660.1 TRAP transporter large permease [Draconibacterium halophilum]
MEFLGVIVLVVSFIILLVIGVPIAISIGISGILTMLVSIMPLAAATTFAQRMATGLDSFALLAIPFFILAGNIMNKGGIAMRLIAFARVLVGRWPAGLAFVNVFANMLFGAISGSAAASASAIGSIMMPEMNKEGYDKNFSAAVNITSATTGLSIPPSNILIVYSLASGGVSITALFLAGYAPGILTGLAIMAVAMGMFSYKHFGFKGMVRNLGKFFAVIASLALVVVGLIKVNGAFSAGVATAIYGGLAVLFLGGIGYYGSKHKKGALNALHTFWRAFPSLLMLVIVIGGIVGGFFTATEASAVAVLYALVLAFIYRELTLKDLPDVILRSVKTTAFVLLLVATCIGLSWIMAYENIPQNVSEALLALSDNKFVILLIINMILLFVGVFMDMTPAVLIFTPIFLPIVTNLGLDPVHFGIIMVLNLSVGLGTPPVGSLLFIGCSVSQVKIETVIRPLIPMFIAMIVCLLLVTYIPEISMWLPVSLGF